MSWDEHGWVVPLAVLNVFAFTMVLGRFPPRWFPAPNIRGREEYFRGVVFRTMGIIFVGLEAMIGLLWLLSPRK